MEKKKAKSVKAKNSAKPARKPKVQNKPVQLPEEMWERVAKRAYELYEQRGGQHGCDLADWLQAEREIRKA